MNLLKQFTNEHIKKFGVEPVIIGINWSNLDAIIDGIEKALETNKPYDEHDQLSKEELEAFKSGGLVF